MMGWWNWDAGAWLGMGAGMVVWLVLTVLIVWLAVRMLGSGNRPPTEPPAGQARDTRQAPDEILRERFARGDIDAEEYRQRLGVLRES